MGVQQFVSGVARLAADLWGGSAPTIGSNLRRVSATQRQQDYSIALSLYEGQHEHFLREDIDNQYSNHFTRKQRRNSMFYFNVLRKIIDGRARVYKAMPKFSGGSPLVSELLSDGSCWGEMIQADRISELCDICPVLILPTKDNRLSFECVPPDQAMIDWDPYNKNRIRRFVSTTEAADAEGGKTSIYRDVWTRDAHRIYRDDLDVTDEVAEAQGLVPTGGVNPWGEVPVVIMRPRVAGSNNPWGQVRQDLIRAQRQLNVKLTDLNYLIKLYYSQVVIEGDPKKLGDFQVGADRPLILKQELEGKSPTAKYLTPEVEIGAIWDTIKQLIQYLAFNEGLAALWDQGGTASTSGESRKVANADMQEIRESKRPAHLRFWQDAERMAHVVLGLGEPDPSDRIKVEFGDVGVYRDAEEERAAWLEEIKAGISTRAQWYQETHAGTSDEDAEAAVKKNLEAERALMSAGQSPQVPPAEQFMGKKALEQEGENAKPPIPGARK